MAFFSNVQALMSHFNSLPTRHDPTNHQNSELIQKMSKLKPVDMNKPPGTRPSPKPLIVKPNFTVNSIETRLKAIDAAGLKPPIKGQQEYAFLKSPKTGATPPVMPKMNPQKDSPAAEETNSADLSVPKKKTLPSVFALGKCPAKPARPSLVDLGKYGGNVSNTNNSALSVLPPPPPGHPSITSVTPPPPADFSFLPPPPMDQEDFYDDAGIMDQTQTSLVSNTKNTVQAFSFLPPPPPGHPSITSVTPPPPADFSFLPPPLTDQEDFYDDTGVMDQTQGTSSNNPEEEEEEMYEDLEHNWPENSKDTKEEKTTKESKELKKKLDKEEKKRLEQEKKEKKEREKRQQEAMKKFKIKSPIVVMETVKVRVDHKGGKNKLPLKQGESIEIVRKTENPKEYWLARNTEGHYGFVKPDTLNVVHDGLKDTQDEQEVYDDVGADDDPPDAAEGNEDIYECPEDQQADFSFPPPPPSDGFELNGEGANDETYDDVLQADFPPPPSSNSVPQFSSTSKATEMDPKKKKKFEKEEKEFRKKFKYNAEIKVLYEATVLQTLAIKKFGNKDLPVKPGETIDVILHQAGDKLIGRNSEGKFGYVFTANLEPDGSVYDDVGDECIYDND
ncbi:FYN-binding protein 1 [Danio aesculapii]|uniref:FYN-binding protein 1 n=1 Tax=Danio aesculapii TaxID=1142201 RepID=UPI0024C04593|nr:FYN-binding protein 1 [Danio aesculapii]